jgi:hypothetical protein
LTTNSIAYLDESTAAGWERTLYAFLAEKERRSGSKRTEQSYTRMLHDFFGRTNKTPDAVTSQDVFAWGYGLGLSGREPSPITIGARVACLSSFYRFPDPDEGPRTPATPWSDRRSHRARHED